jgi:hypothetical protein
MLLNILILLGPVYQVPSINNVKPSFKITLEKIKACRKRRVGHAYRAVGKDREGNGWHGKPSVDER